MCSAKSSKQPDLQTIEVLFQKCLTQLDLPPDKLKTLRDYPAEKKWEMIRDQDLVSEKHPPSYYIHLLRSYHNLSNATTSKFAGFRWKNNAKESRTILLTGLEISLRTNSINWVNVFLSNECDGLGALIDYLRICLDVMIDMDSNVPDTIIRKDLKDPNVRRQSRPFSSQHKRFGFECLENEIRLCIMCIKSIMNNQNGFNLILQHPYALNCITNCLCHRNRRIKSMILDLLAAVCLVEHGHDLVINAFNSFRTCFNENRRFESLVNDFRCNDCIDIELMISYIQFVNIIVHSVRNMDYRVALQYEFASLGFTDCLTRLQIQFSDADHLQVQIQAYIDNCIDVNQLLDDSDAKMDALNRISELEEKLGVASEKIQEMEKDNTEQLACIKRQLHDARRKADFLQLEKNDALSCLDQIKKSNSERSSSCSYEYNQNSLADFCVPQIEQNANSTNNGLAYESCSSIYSTFTNNYAQIVDDFSFTNCKIPEAPGISTIEGQPPPAPPPPPALPLPLFNQHQSNYVRSDIHSIPNGSPTSMTIKKVIETKHKLPCLNWTVLKPQQVKGTIFCELNEDKYYNLIDFDKFEELFQSNCGFAINNNQANHVSPQLKKKIRQNVQGSLLDGQRQRNLAIARRKLNMTTHALVRAINSLDLISLSCENVEILQHLVPNDMEIKSFDAFIAESKDPKALSKEDQFLLCLIRIERLSQKLSVMNFMGNFNDVKSSITPQLKVVLQASNAIRNSDNMKRLLEIILAFGNYMNSSKRGPVYGFKLQSFDALLEIRSQDKKMTLLHYIVLIIGKQFPEISKFPLDLKCLEKASSVSLENVQLDVQDLVKGLEIVKKEYKIRKELKQICDGPPIASFLEDNETEVDILVASAKQTQEAFTSCIQYYGESPKSQTCSSFFGYFLKFQKAFEQSFNDLKDRLKVEFTNFNSECTTKKPSVSCNNIAEHNESQLEDKHILRQMDVTEGTIESLLEDLKRAPYVRADAVRRNRRKTREITR
ncbi:hypothetical protein GJ496_007462 [Pomphorhynchus laevis]|nr:hypothetical protein GJ496_007462 [Pomphorhynchus laevis]